MKKVSVLSAVILILSNAGTASAGHNFRHRLQLFRRSKFPLGTYGRQVDVDAAAACMKAAYEKGVNFFDNAEAYEAGKSEEVMGAVLKKLGWRRASYVVSTKIFWGLHDGVNERNTLNRKRLREGIDGALKRFGLDYVDLVFCHRPDPETPDRRDGLVHAHDGGIREGPVLGHLGMERGRAQGSVGCRGKAPPAQAADGAAAVQHVRAPEGGTGIRAAVLRASASGSPSGARWRRVSSQASTTPASPRTPAWRCPGTKGCKADPLQRGVPAGPAAPPPSPRSWTR